MARNRRVPFEAAGVGDHIMYAQTASEPGKLSRLLRVVTGGVSDRGKTRGSDSGTAEWRIGA